MAKKSKNKKPTKKLELSPKQIAKLVKQNAQVNKRLAKKKRLYVSEADTDRFRASAKLHREGIPIDEDTLKKYMQKFRDDREAREALAKASSLKRNKKKSKAYKRKISSY